MRFYNNRLLAINLCRLVLGGQTVKYLRLVASKFELDQSQRKSTQDVASGWPNETQVERKSKICVDLRVRLARTLVCFEEDCRHVFICGNSSRKSVEGNTIPALLLRKLSKTTNQRKRRQIQNSASRFIIGTVVNSTFLLRIMVCFF